MYIYMCVWIERVCTRHSWEWDVDTRIGLTSVFRYRELTRFSHVMLCLLCYRLLWYDRVCMCHSSEWDVDTCIGLTAVFGYRDLTGFSHVVFMLPFFCRMTAYPCVILANDEDTPVGLITVFWYSGLTVFLLRLGEFFNVLVSMYVCVVPGNDTWIYGSVWPVVYWYRELNRF